MFYESFLVTGESDDMWLTERTYHGHMTEQKMPKKWPASLFCQWDFRTCPHPKDMMRTQLGHFQLRHICVSKILLLTQYTTLGWTNKYEINWWIVNAKLLLNYFWSLTILSWMDGILKVLVFAFLRKNVTGWSKILCYRNANVLDMTLK